ncbi:MAG TPA: SDR family oxidoreductase [Gemmatimonas sp.]|nr:SDR family oxidoreductase [Gemmatimonas sp.]
MNFTDKLFVITGVGRAGQVGEALALSLAQRGATLALLDLKQSDVDARAGVLREAGFTVTAHAADLSNADAAEAAAERVIAATRDRFGGVVHGVVCAAGGFGTTGPIDESDPAAWHRQFVINLDTAFNATRAFLPAVRQARGAFAYFGSVAALPGGDPSGIAAYAAAKSGVLALMQAVAHEERAHGVRANAVVPVAVRTAANVDAMGDKTSYVERESVADVVAFLLSPLARNVSGQAIVLA